MSSNNNREPMFSVLSKLHVEFKTYPQIDKNLKDQFYADLELLHTPPVSNFDLKNNGAMTIIIAEQLSQFAVFLNKYVERDTRMEFISLILRKQFGFYFDQNGETYHLDYSPRRSEIVYMPDYMKFLKLSGIKVKGYLQSRVRDKVGIEQE